MSRLPSQHEISEMAKTVFASQGDEAPRRITQHIGDLMASGDLLAVSIWREVRKAVAVLQQERCTTNGARN